MAPVRTINNRMGVAGALVGFLLLGLFVVLGLTNVMPPETWISAAVCSVLFGGMGAYAVWDGGVVVFDPARAVVRVGDEVMIHFESVRDPQIGYATIRASNTEHIMTEYGTEALEVCPGTKLFVGSLMSRRKLQRLATILQAMVTEYRANLEANREPLVSPEDLQRRALVQGALSPGTEGLDRFLEGITGESCPEPDPPDHVPADHDDAPPT